MLLLRQLSKASRPHSICHARGVSANRFFSEITERSATNRDRRHRLARVRCAARRAVSYFARSKNTRAFLFLVFKKCAFPHHQKAFRASWIAVSYSHTVRRGQTRSASRESSQICAGRRRADCVGCLEVRAVASSAFFFLGRD